MEELRRLLQEAVNETLHHIILSNTRDVKKASKVKIRPVLLKGKLVFQETLYRGTQVFHGNYDAAQTVERVEEYLGELFRQAQIQGNAFQVNILVSKKGKMTIKQKKENISRDKKISPEIFSAKLAHNRTKQYILREGEPADFLVGLGVQTPDGKITRTKYDKFRQINRYLEFIEDVLEELPKDRCIRIIDFGCGKSYLTFAMYYYLYVLQKRDIEVTGLDLKTDVIEHCNLLAKKLGYDKLHFEHGDISNYEGCNAVDLVVTLHACDTATDYALEKAVKWGASVILAVPCCQHEINRQIKCNHLQSVLKYGIIKERMSALITDALRADILEQCGYSTQILEFIDMEHTPKNLLIRAVKKQKPQKMQKPHALLLTEEFLHVSPTLQRLLLDGK